MGIQETLNLYSETLDSLKYVIKDEKVIDIQYLYYMKEIKDRKRDYINDITQI